MFEDMIDREDPLVRVALIDVELFVSAGVPRSAFKVVPETERGGSPRFEVRSSVLTHEVPQSEDEAAHHYPVPPHPYELGPMWQGSGCWTADLGLDDLGQACSAVVHHRWCRAQHFPLNFPECTDQQLFWTWAYVRGVRAVYGCAESPSAATHAAMSRHDPQSSFNE